MDIQNFINEKFGSIRVITEDGSEWFVAKDIAKCLGYTDTKQAIRKHVDDEYKKDIKLEGVDSTPSSYGGLRHIMVINEFGVYQLIMSSKMPDAKDFQRWVFEEVLPSIRNTGGYLDEERKEIRTMITESRTAFTSAFDLLTWYTYISREEADYVIRRLTIIANNLSGFEPGRGKRNKATSNQMIKVNIIESSFAKTIHKRIKQYLIERTPIDVYKLIRKCEKNAKKKLKNNGFELDNVYITVD